METLRVAAMGPAPIPRIGTGGAERHTGSLLRALVRLGIEVEWFTCARPRGDLASLEPAPNVVRRSALPATIAAPTLDTWKLSRRVRGSFDLVHTLLHVPPYGSAALRVRRAKPLISTVHSLMRQRVIRRTPLSRVHDRIWSSQERKVLQRADRVIVVSPHLEDAVAEMSARRPSFIPNGVEPEWFDLDAQTSDPTALMCLGRVERVNSSVDSSTNK